MKFTSLKLTKSIRLAAVAACTALAGCAGIDASNQESLLSAAGFHTRTPQTAKQQEIYASLPAYKVQHGVANGVAFYAYKDEKKGVAYVGREPEYQRYQQLAVAQSIARDQYQAAEMNRQMAYGWYGAWGTRMVW